MTTDSINKILITGGAGFIGSHLARTLHSKDFSITIIDDFSRGCSYNIHDFSTDIEVINQNILHYNIIEKSIKNADLIFHLAALSRVIPSIKSPGLCCKNNILGTEIIARICSKYKKKLVFSSSREVYGNAEIIPVSESCPLQPENPYGASKIAGESIIRAYSMTYGFQYTILRLSNVYGPYDFNRVIPIFFEQTMKGDDITIFGGTQVIDFIYIQDVVTALIHCLAPKTDNQIFNIGSGIGTDLLSLANTIIQITSSNSNICIREKRSGEVEQFISDISKAKQMLNWTPKKGLYQGLKKTWMWLNENKYS